MIDAERSYWLDRSVKTFTKFVFFGLIIVPSIIEIIVVTQQTLGSRTGTIIICGFLQCMLTAWGGCILGELLSTNRVPSVFCKMMKSPTDYKSMLTAEYPMCVLPQWLFTNIIIWFVWMSSGSARDHQPSIIVGFIVFAPIGVYVVAIFMGWMYASRLKSSVDHIYETEYESV